MKKIIFGLIGLFLGIPLSYYFQSSMLQNKVGGLGGYMQHFDEILNNTTLAGNVLLSVLIFTLIGGLIGHYFDKNEEKKQS